MVIVPNGCSHSLLGSRGSIWVACRPRCTCRSGRDTSSIPLSFILSRLVNRTQPDLPHQAENLSSCGVLLHWKSKLAMVHSIIPALLLVLVHYCKPSVSHTTIPNRSYTGHSSRLLNLRISHRSIFRICLFNKQLHTFSHKHNSVRSAGSRWRGTIMILERIILNHLHQP